MNYKHAGKSRSPKARSRRRRRWHNMPEAVRVSLKGYWNEKVISKILIKYAGRAKYEWLIGWRRGTHHEDHKQKKDGFMIVMINKIRYEIGFQVKSSFAAASQFIRTFGHLKIPVVVVMKGRDKKRRTIRWLVTIFERFKHRLLGQSQPDMAVAA